MDDINISELSHADAHSVDAINNLLSQLSASRHVVTTDTLNEILSSPCSHLFVAYAGQKIVGMITVGHYMAPTGTKLWIEDVVVDSEARGKSIGCRLVQHAVAFAGSIGGTLMLTSRPTRKAANALYASAGFELKETNVYKMKIEKQP